MKKKSGMEAFALHKKRICIRTLKSRLHDRQLSRATQSVPTSISPHLTK